MKFLRKATAVLLFALMFVSVLTFTACNKDGEEGGEVTYTFSVELHDGSPAAGVGIIVCSGTACDSPIFTGSDGKVSVTKPAAEYTVHLMAPPQGYKCDQEFTTDLKGTLITFKCVAAE